MQKLIIKNLGPIKDCEIELKPFTIFIGESGSGKSIILRTTSMLKWIYKRMQYKNLLKLSKVKSDSIRLTLTKIIRDAMLDDYLTSETYIKYIIDNKDIILIENKKLKPYYNNLSSSKFTLSKIVFLNENRTALPEIFSTSGGRRLRFSYYTEDMINNFFEASNEIGENFKVHTVDIKLGSAKAVGYKQFLINRDGKKIKFEHASSGEKNASILELITSYFSSGIYDLRQNFIKNIYFLLENNSLLQSDEKIRNLLSFWGKLKKELSLSLFIEEPESNLFPTNQKNLTYFLSSLQKMPNNPEIIFSTHSPYILTSLNNLLYAAELSNKNKELKNKVKQIIPSEYHINLDDFQAYMVKDNSVSSIIDKETNLINAKYIDAVSNEIMSDFDKLYELE